MTHSIKCFYYFLLSLTVSLSRRPCVSCRYYYSRSWTLQETMTICAHWKRRWRREKVVNLLVVRLVSNSRFGASHPLSVCVCVCAVCASWNNIINMYKKKIWDENEFTLSSVATCQCGVAWGRLVVFLIRFLAICGKGEPALCGGHVTASARMHVSSQRERERDRHTHRRTTDVGPSAEVDIMYLYTQTTESERV